MRRMMNASDKPFAVLIHTIIAGVIANVRERDDRWFMLALGQLGVSVNVLRDYLAHGDSVLLANLLNIIHKVCHELLAANLAMTIEVWFILQLLAKFDAKNTLPKLQHDFCAVWNEIVLDARSRQTCLPHKLILSSVGQVYIALHQGTDAAPTSFTACTSAIDPIFDRISSYPLCTIQGHRHLDRFPQAVDGETAPSFAATLSTRPDLRSFFAVPDLDRAKLSLGDVPDARQSSTPVASSSCLVSGSLNRDHRPAASLDITTASATKRNAVISSTANTIPRSSPSGSVVPQHTESTLITPQPLVFDVPCKVRPRVGLGGARYLS